MRKGRVLEATFDDLQYNLALEEAIFSNLPKSNFQMVLRFWRNPPSVVLGQDQNIKSEVDETYCLLNDIQIGRRISEGDTEYHDGGTLNISLYINKNDLSDLETIEQYNEFFTNAIIESLKNSSFSDIEIDARYETWLNLPEASNRRLSGSPHVR